ncbi:MAG: hypothetical protein MHM6MM_006583 [Cercozoa sp. M6MM]
MNDGSESAQQTRASGTMSGRLDDAADVFGPLTGSTTSVEAFVDALESAESLHEVSLRSALHGVVVCWGQLLRRRVSPSVSASVSPSVSVSDGEIEAFLARAARCVIARWQQRLESPVAVARAIVAVLGTRDVPPLDRADTEDGEAPLWVTSRFSPKVLNQHVPYLPRGIDEYSGDDGDESKESATVQKLRRRGVNLYRQKHARAAADHFSAALELQPRNARVRSSRALALLALGHVDDALRDCDFLLAMNPRDKKAAHLRAIALGKKAQFAEAVATLAPFDSDSDGDQRGVSQRIRQARAHIEQSEKEKRERVARCRVARALLLASPLLTDVLSELSTLVRRLLACDASAANDGPLRAFFECGHFSQSTCGQPEWSV